MKLEKKVVLKVNIELETGLHIGAGDNELGVGGIDSPVMKDPISKAPYIPGSSIKGKMRSLLEKMYSDKNNDKVCQCGECNACKLCGVGANDNKDKNIPNVLIVRDFFLTNEKELEDLETDLKYTEAKTENNIDRITGKAMPRTLERVIKGAKFGGEIIVNIYENQKDENQKDENQKDENQKDENLKTLAIGLQLLKDDYLGGSGSRGYGRVKIEIENIEIRDKSFYENKSEENKSEENKPDGIIDEIFKNLMEKK